MRYTRGPQNGPAANRNNGAAFANGNWLIFTDDDCLPDKGWLEAYANAIEQYPESKAIEGAILPDDWELLKRDMAECPVNTDGGCFWSANIAIGKTFFERLGGFDSSFKLAAHEDKELYERILKIETVLFIKNAFVIHPVRFISLRSKLKMIPVRLKNWRKYESSKMGDISMFFKGINFQLRSFISNIFSGRWKMGFYNILVAFLLLPFFIYENLRK